MYYTLEILLLNGKIHFRNDVHNFQALKKKNAKERIIQFETIEKRYAFGGSE